MTDETLALDRAETYALAFPNVQGYALPSGWFAIALGPYDAITAEAELRQACSATIRSARWP